MISVSEATAIIFANLFHPKTISVSIQESVGLVLDENIIADRDLPPFDRVTMDGIAINFDAWMKGRRKFQVENLQAAGEPQKKLTQNDNAIEVMTGAVLPSGTDTVIRYEDLKLEKPWATILTENIEKGQSIHRKGQDAAKDEILLSSGMKISAAEIALMASIGKSKVKVKSYPSAAIVASGDELVAVEESPLPHQIRRSNSYALQSAMKEMGWNADQFHLKDDKDELRKELKNLLDKYDVIILSGGVSQGKFDFIPQVMEELGVQKKIHQVSQRPGKPLWFGTSANGKVVFALPGNPVSTFMCFYKYVRPWLQKSFGIESRETHAILAKDFSFTPKLTYFLQVHVVNEHGKLMAYPDAGGGSGDFANLKKIDGFLELPAERQDFKGGEAFPFIPFRL
jgi:molybdopterin molybdotransferase